MLVQSVPSGKRPYLPENHQYQTIKPTSFKIIYHAVGNLSYHQRISLFIRSLWMIKKNLDPSLHYRNCDQQKCIVSLQCLYAVTRLVIPNFSIKCGIITSISLNFLNRSEMRPYTFVTGDLEGSVMCSCLHHLDDVARYIKLNPDVWNHLACLS